MTRQDKLGKLSWILLLSYYKYLYYKFLPGFNVLPYLLFDIGLVTLRVIIQKSRVFPDSFRCLIIRDNIIQQSFFGT